MVNSTRPEDVDWTVAASAMLQRARHTAVSINDGFPHWADSVTGEWTTTPDGDWTGGALPGMLWLGYRMTGERNIQELATEWCLKLIRRCI